MMVLVTGAAGYIGSHLLCYLHDAGWRITALDDFSEGHHDAIKVNVEVYDCNLLDFSSLVRIFSSHPIKAVVHLAAKCSASESIEKPQKYYLNNLVGTLNLLRAAVDFGVKRFVFASDCAVYGRPRVKTVSETLKPSPLTPYARTKTLCEESFPDYHHAYGITTVSLRLFNVGGAFHEHNIGESHRIERHIIPNIFKVALGQKEALDIHGADLKTSDGTSVRDFVHIRDVCAAIEAALEKPLVRPSVFNIGSGVGTSILQLVKISQKITGKTIKTRITPKIPTEAVSLVADIDSARRELDYTPKYSEVETILKDAWAWHRKHPQGFVTERKLEKMMFGTIAVELGFITKENLAKALELQKEQDSKGEHKL
ncbi:MAG: UDP-glucose 4-epimerase GalE, partial [Planctomycetota bacterium]|nr:UDP-glucose 4-epimerase GalE [Planctomycetota bacterium]